MAAVATPAAGRARAGDNVWTGGINFNWSTNTADRNWSLAPLYWGNQFIDCAFFNGTLPGNITVTTRSACGA